MKLNVTADPSSVGHHFLIGLQPAVTLTEHDKRLLSLLKPAGVVLFKQNFDHNCSYAEWLEKYRNLIKAVRSYVERERLMVCIDHEGGFVTRTPFPITAYGSARTWADVSREVGSAMGVELRSLGVNVSFAPVVDIDSNPK